MKQDDCNDAKDVKIRRFVKHGIYIAVAVFCIVLMMTVLISISTSVNKQSYPFKNVKSVASTPLTSQGIVSRTPTSIRIPILMYHSINYQKGNKYRVPISDFAAEMKWLHNNNYQTLTMDTLYYDISNNVRFSNKSVVITFDDGYKDNYTAAFPIIKKYHFSGTVFIITSKIGDTKDGFLSADMLNTMDKNGMSIECHTITHPHLSNLSYKEQYSELENSKLTLEKLLNKKIYYFAYPYGDYNADTIKAAEQIGYRICFLSDGGAGLIYDNNYEFPRVFAGQDLQAFIDSIKDY